MIRQKLALQKLIHGPAGEILKTKCLSVVSLLKKYLKPSRKVPQPNVTVKHIPETGRDLVTVLVFLKAAELDGRANKCLSCKRLLTASELCIEWLVYESRGCYLIE